MLVSVYLPTKDRIERLRKAVDSVLGQTHRDLELIVIDDGSSDGTPAYLAALAARDPRVLVIRHDAPHGAPRSRNEAIRRSRGAFATGLDDDDEFLPERLESFVAYWDFLSARGVRPAFLYAQDVIVKSPTHRYVWRKAGQAMARDMFAGNYVGNQIFAPRQHFIDAGLFDEDLPVWQDLEFFLRLLKRYGTAYLLDLATYVFDDAPRDDRITSKSRAKLMQAFQVIADRHAGGDPVLRQRLWMQLFSPYNGLRPTVGDWWRFASLGMNLEGAVHMFRAMRLGVHRWGASAVRRTLRSAGLRR
jgi:glycosyltransferase involved in cell wall biosynthesis